MTLLHFCCSHEIEHGGDDKIERRTSEVQELLTPLMPNVEGELKHVHSSKWLKLFCQEIHLYQL